MPPNFTLSNTPPAGITPALAAAGTGSDATPVTLAVTPDNTAPGGITPALAAALNNAAPSAVTLNTTPSNTAPEVIDLG